MNSATISQSSLFSTFRFGALLKKYLGENGRRILMLSGSLTIIFIIITFLRYFTSFESTYQVWAQRGMTGTDPMWGGNMEWMTFMLIVAASVAGSMMYSSMSTPAGRLATIEVPASQFEKFLVRFLIWVPLFYVIFFACFYISEFIRVAYIHLFNEGGEIAAVIPLNRFFQFRMQSECYSWNPSAAFEVTMIYSIILLINGFFVLGGIIFNKQAYIKTLCTLFALQTILGGIAAFSGYLYFRGSYYMGNADESISYSGALLLAGCSLAFYILLQWIAYARFKESEIINRW